jgi:hypothetical protein
MLVARGKGDHGGKKAFSERDTASKKAASEEARFERRCEDTRQA